MSVHIFEASSERPATATSPSRRRFNNGTPLCLRVLAPVRAVKHDIDAHIITNYNSFSQYVEPFNIHSGGRTVWRGQLRTSSPPASGGVAALQHYHALTL